MRLYSMVALFCAFLATPAFASRSTYRNAHPVGWMHLLPVGESPGWPSPVWAEFEINHANIWNMDMTMTDRRTGDVYRYAADFEQSSIIFNMGFQLSERWALSFELPYANRNGGFMDDFIDQFHIAINSDRFLRHLNDGFGNSFTVQKNGENQLASQRSEGLGGAKVKLKWWMWKWLSTSPGACDCGLAFSGQVKFPTQARKFGLSSGNNDYSGLVHLGIPIGKSSSAKMTAAFTKLGPNDTFGEWPRREWLQMYELALDLGVGSRFGFLLGARVESPLFMQEHLNYNFTYIDQDAQRAERIASGWNSLTAWRGSQNLGFRWRWARGTEANLMIVEDWGTGKRDGRSDWLYVNNAPDVAIVSQWHFVF